MKTAIILPTVFFSAIVSVAYYLGVPLLILAGAPLLLLQYYLVTRRQIVDQQSLEAYIMENYGVSCEGKITFVDNVDLYLFFPSKINDNTAIVDRNRCIIKLNGKVKSMGLYEGIEEAISKLCKPEIRRVIAN
ncbi:hypothetical protein L3N51_02438 [Metallosphaera sp. J1]|uniref:hypothetical protein n=1 Tax=Metallosphaera javensis (ex Hofmann et al. 2022) TaxID=99938 RepID=UPI001EE02069|nr:hypothetical protein [Metallosphaera javensis (ex Hofmann et al. 2022)]MCG3110141.1 hypothetical protein [Metallosphaera javensis (ex Hofmann et al. 2022)]